MPAIIKRAETTTYCYESYYFTKQSEMDFMAFQSSITDISQKKKKAPLTLFWTKAKNYDVVLQFYLEKSPSLQGFTAAGSSLSGTENPD